MAKWLSDWLFAGITSSAVLMSVRTVAPEHPLALVARTAGHWLALLCIAAAGTIFYMRRWQSRVRR
jgi:hypothetical protein